MFAAQQAIPLALALATSTPPSPLVCPSSTKITGNSTAFPLSDLPGLMLSSLNPCYFNSRSETSDLGLHSPDSTLPSRCRVIAKHGARAHASAVSWASENAAGHARRSTIRALRPADSGRHEPNRP